MTKTTAPSGGQSLCPRGGLAGALSSRALRPHSLTPRSPDNGNQTPAHPHRAHGCAGWTLLSPDLHVGILGCSQTRAQSAVCEQCSEQEPLTPGSQPRRQLPAYTGGLRCWGPLVTAQPSLSLLQPLLCAVLHRWPLWDPHSQDLCLRACCAHRCRHWHHALCLHPAEHLIQVSWGRILRDAPLPTPCHLSPCPLLPLSSSVSPPALFWGLVPPPATPPSLPVACTVLWGPEKSHTHPKLKTPPVPSPQTPEEKAHLPQLPALLEGQWSGRGHETPQGE